MAGTGLLSNILDYDELIALSEPLVSKLETHLSGQLAEIESLKSSAERVRVNSEQQYFEIEKQLVESNNQLQTESERATSLAEQLADLEQRYDAAAKKLRELEHSEEETLSTQLRLTRSNEQLEGEKRDLAVLLEKRSKEIEWLTEENKTLGEKVSTTNAAKCEALAQLEEINSQDVMAKYREKRLEQEKEMLEKQYEWLKSELDKKSQDLVNVRKDQTSNVLEIQSQLEEKTQEVVMLQDIVDSLRGEKEGQARRITDLVERLRDMTESYAQSEEQFRLELQSQKKLAELYKESSEEAEAKSDELYRATEELRRLVMEASESYQELEKGKADIQEKHEVELKEKAEKISGLEEELETANALMRTARLKGLALTEDEIEALSPAAAAASKLLKSGMTLTQIYSEYTKNYDALQAEKEENARLNQYVNEIIQEIEEKAPLLRRQREDYEVSLQTISQLTRQLDLAMLEREKTHSEADESKRKASHFQRESQKVKQLNLDLGQQVRYLLKEVEELRGGRVVRDDTPSPDVTASNSSEIITARLINFRTVEELQSQNQSLLEVVRDLSERLEEEEKEATDARTAELKSQLTTALEEIEEFKAARSRQMEMVESIIRQRDMYRVLLGQTDNAPPLLTGTEASPIAPTTPTSGKAMEVDQPRTDEMKTALAELKSEYETYRRERVENEKILSEQLEVQRTEASSLRVQNAKLVAQLDFATERYKILQSNAESYKKEISSQRDKNQKYTVSVMKHEMTINTLKQDMMTKQELMSRLEVENQNLRVEKDLLKNAESRLLQEKHNLLREQSSQNVLMTSLQTIQNNLERAEYETKAKLGKQAEDLEREVSGLRRKMETERDQQTAATRHWESQVTELRGQLDGELTRHQVTRAQLAEASNKLLTVQRELSQKEGELKAAETKLHQTSGEDRGDGGQGSRAEVAEVMEQVKDLKTQLRQAEAEAKALRSQVQKASERADHYKNIADGIEKGLKEQNEVSKQFKESLEMKLKEVEEQKSRLDEQMSNMDKERHDLMNENIRVTEESHKLNGELRRQCASLQHELEEALERREAAIKVEQTSREDCQAQAGIAAEAQDKYQRELMLHAADVEAFTALKKEMEGFTGKLETVQEQCRIAVNQLEVGKSSWTEQEKLLKGECNKLDQRCIELTQQNAVLHEQMSKLSSQVVSIQQSALDSDAAANVSLTSPTKSQEGEKSAEQLLEVIRFIRREKEIAETKLEVIQSETNRLKQQNGQLERQLRETSASLAEERERSQVSVQTASQHAELMKKVENHNLLTDSNRLLRDEKEKYLQQLRELEIKTKSFEEQIAPLQKQNRELQAQCDAVVAEKAGLQGEVDRWKNRTNHLIEQCNKADPEEQNRLIQERENLRRQISTLNEATYKLRAENSRLSAKIQSTQREVSTAKEGMVNQNQEMDKLRKDQAEQLENLKKELATKSTELDEKGTTINQLKRIGRKYKEQVEVMTKEREDTRTELAQLKQQHQQDQASSSSADETASAMAEKLSSAEKERDELKSKLEARDTELTGVKESLEKLQAELSQHNESTLKLKNEIAEHEKKQAQSRTLLQTARNRFTSQKTDLEKVTGENTNLKEKVENLQAENDTLQGQLSAVQTSADERVTQLEQELQQLRQSGPATPADTKQSVDKLRRDNTELQARVQQLQKMIEAQQQGVGKKPIAQRPPVKSPAERIGMGASEASRTANIRPMATPTAGIRPATPVSSGPSATKVTASVRPMAITPATTPTATVMPTTLSSQDTHEEASTSVPTGTVQGRPAQRVAPQVDVTVSEPLPGPSEPPEAPQPVISSEPQPSTSRVTPPADPGHPQPGKRQRQESDSQDVDSEPEGKKSRVALEGGVLPTITVTDSDSVTVTAVMGDKEAPEEGVKAAEQEEVLEMEGQEEEPQEEHVQEETIEETIAVEDESADQPGDQSTLPSSQEEEEAEVILVESDDEEEGDEEDEEEIEEEEEEEEVEVEESGEEMEGEEGEEYEEEEEFEEGEEDYGEESQEMEGDTPADDDEVVVVDLEDSGDGDIETQEETTEASQSQEQATAPPVTTGQRPPPPLQPIIAPTPTNRNTLAPFMFAAGQPGPYEEGDDCTVPSTPTLYVPRRGDGFAEAISSPHVPQRFVFGAGLESGQNQPEIAQLGSQGALGMDDTRMDLSQFDDGNSRPTSSNSAALAAPEESAPSEPAPSDATSVNLSTTSATDQGEATPGQAEPGDTTASHGQQETSETAAEVPPETAEETAQAETSESQGVDITDTGETAGEAPVEGEGGEDLAEGDRPSPSNQADRSQLGATGQARPRIQRITWDADSGPPGPPQPSPGQGPPIRMPPGRGRIGHISPGRGGPSMMRGRPMYAPRRGSGRGFRSMRGRRGAF